MDMTMLLIFCKGKRHYVSLVFITMLVLIFFALLNGCATTGTTSKATKESVSPPSDEIPKEVKVTKFILGPGDSIEITVYRHNDLNKTIKIDPSGKMTYPFVGDIEAAGLSIFQLRDKIRDGLSKYIKDPQVSVSITTAQSQKYIVLGEVKNPGLFTLDNPVTALKAISIAGGFTVNAKQKNVLLIRSGLNKPELITLNIDKFFNEQDMTQNVSIQNEDVIYVPETVIEDVSRFFDHLARVLAPISPIASGYLSGRGNK